jgi:hypothetical protein
LGDVGGTWVDVCFRVEACLSGGCTKEGEEAGDITEVYLAISLLFEVFSSFSPEVTSLGEDKGFRMGNGLIV